MSTPVNKYNPSFLSDDELADRFVVRHADLKLVVDTVRENTTRSNQHVLVVGPRGIGKTMLVQRVAAAVRSDPDLSERWYPLSYAEESYEVLTPGEFWLEALFHLGQQTGDDRWHAIYDDLKKNELDEARLRQRALGHLMEFAEAQGKRILLLVENACQLFTQQIDKDDAWVIRDTLQNEPRIMLLASAVSRFEDIESEGRAMYDLFRVQELAPLDTAECTTVWNAITGQDAEPRRIRPIEILTGGNPRLLVVISSFAANRSLRNLMENLVQLVDDHTDYFKSHLDVLPAHERKVFAALADIWDPATSRQVGDATRMTPHKVSSLLSRLVSRGAVTVVRRTKRKKHYQLSERLYNIYYLMRRRGGSHARVQAVVRFMVEFYAGPELVSMAGHIADEALKLGLEVCADHLATLELLLKQSLDDGLKQEVFDAIPEELRKSMALPDTFLVAEPDVAVASSEHEYPTEAIALIREIRDASRVRDARTACALTRQAAARFPGIEKIQDMAAVASECEGVFQRVLDSLEGLVAYAGSPEWDENGRRILLDVVTGFAALGYGVDSLAVLEASPRAAEVEPLIVALKLDMGQDVMVADEVMAMAKDTVEAIRKAREDFCAKVAASGDGTTDAQKENDGA